MIVQTVLSTDIADISIFLEDFNGTTFWHSTPYRSFITKLTGAKDVSIVCRDTNGAVNGFIPILQLDHPAGRVWNSLPYFGSHGDILTTSPEVTRRVSKFLNQKLTSENVGAFCVVRKLDTAEQVSCSWTHQVCRISQVSAIGETNSNNLMSLFSSKQRNAIRKGFKQGFSIGISSDGRDSLETLHAENLAQLSGVRKSPEFFKSLDEFFTRGPDYQIWEAKHNDDVIASLLLFYWRETVEYFMPAVRDGYRSSQVLSAVIFTAMEHAVNHGFKSWNWGGTWKSQHGVKKFKAGWGAHETLYTYDIKVQTDSNLTTLTSEQVSKFFPNFFVFPF